MDKVYGFSNENLKSYLDIYNFDNASVLSVIGSGDQYFTALLGGASNITLYDININAWHYFLLKFISIKYLNYEEFVDFFIESNLNNQDIYFKIRNYLPDNTRLFWDRFIELGICFSFLKISTPVYDRFKVSDYEKIIPYLKEEQYYKLKDILNNIKYPKVFIDDFINIACLRNLESYDLTLLSNIYKWVDISVIEFRKILDLFNSKVFQAMYEWSYSSEIDLFVKYGFKVSQVESVNKGMLDNKNYVLTYKK